MLKESAKKTPNGSQKAIASEPSIEESAATSPAVNGTASTEAASKTKKVKKSASASKASSKGGPASSEKENDAVTKKQTPTLTYFQMVLEAIAELKDWAKGSSMVAISKWIQAKYPHTVGPCFKSRFLLALKTGVEKGRLIKLRNSYKLSPAFKAQEKKKTADAKRKLAAAARAKATVATAETKKQNAEKLAKKMEEKMSPEDIAKAKRNLLKRKEALRKKEEAERKAKERADILRKRRYPLEDTKLHAEDKQLGVKTDVPARPSLPYFWQLAVSNGSKLSQTHQTAAKVDTLDSGNRGLVPDLLQVYHFWRGDVQFRSADGEEHLVPEFTLQNLMLATNEILMGHSKATRMLPPLIVHLFCVSLSVLLNSDLENPDLSPARKNLFKELHKFLSPVLTPASCPDVCFLYMDAMERFYTSDASYDNNVLPPLNTDMNYLLGQSDTPVVPMTPALNNDKKGGAALNQFASSDHSLPLGYTGYLGDSRSALNRAHYKLHKMEAWLLSAEELMALLRALTDDILANNPVVSEDIASREEEMQVLSKNKRVADANFRKARLAFEGPKKPSKKADDSTKEEKEKNGNSKEEAKEDDQSFKPTISRKKYDAACKAQQKASDAYEKGIRKLVARTQPVGYDRNFNAVYCFRHDPEALYVEDVRPATFVSTQIPEDIFFPKCSWHVVSKTSLFDSFVGSLDVRGKREHDLLEELVGPPGAHQSLRRFLEDDLKLKAEASSRRKEMESLKKKLEIAKVKCDEEKGRRSGRLASQAEEELCQVEDEIKAIDRLMEEKAEHVKLDSNVLTGLDLMRKFDSAGRIETRRSREKKEASKTLNSFQCSKLVSSGNIDGTGIIGMLVSDLLELEETCEALVPWEGVDRSTWIAKLEGAVHDWNSISLSQEAKRASLDHVTQSKRDSLDSSTSKKRRLESPGMTSNPSTSSHSVLTALKQPILELEYRIADMTNVAVATRDAEIADENMSVDSSGEDEAKKKRLEKQWKKIVHRIRSTSTRRHVKIREMLVEALAAARKAHLPQIVAELRSALLQYHPQAASDCKNAAIQILEANGDYDEEDDDMDSDDEEEEQAEETEAEQLPSVIAAEAAVILSSLGGSVDATRSDWIDAVNASKTVARLASLTSGFVHDATEKLRKLQEERDALTFALGKWEKETERRAKKVGRPCNEFEGPSEVWANVTITDEICMAKTEDYPWWPAKKCTAKEPVVSQLLSKLDRSLVSLVGEMGGLRVVKNDLLQPFTGAALDEDSLSDIKKELRTQLDDCLAMARRTQRGLLNRRKR